MVCIFKIPFFIFNHILYKKGVDKWNKRLRIFMYFRWLIYCFVFVFIWFYRGFQCIYIFILSLAEKILKSRFIILWQLIKILFSQINNFLKIFKHHIFFYFSNFFFRIKKRRMLVISGRFRLVCFMLEWIDNRVSRYVKRLISYLLHYLVIIKKVRMCVLHSVN